MYNVENQMQHVILIQSYRLTAYCCRISGVAKGGKWEHAPRGADLGGASAHFLQLF